MRFLFITFLFLTTVSSYGQVEKISAILEEINSKEHLSGVVLVGQGEEIIFQKAYGKANQSFSVSNTLDTKFLVGSLTKQFTAVLVMQLVEAYQLNLDEPISTYLPDFRKDLADKITIRHLLTHTHGIPNTDLLSRYKPMSKEEFVREYCEIDFEFQPGTQFEYSNIVGYYLLGVILKKVTGQDFPKLLEDKILGPLDMQNTGYYSKDTVIQNLATGYIQKEMSFLYAPHWDMSQSFSAAGMYSTIGDLFKWDRALRSTQLLSSSGIETIFTPYSDEIRYGFAWHINDPEINGKRLIFAGHNGGANGYKSQFMRGVNKELVVIYLSNTDQYVELRYPLIEVLMSNEN
ncbi:serine hydrolase domain-containing protein [uncultured Marivirga sp.]|uniref:serine hydrolase domain-containing protein n=1 Tax=uncultured Marivirga sp. TaxID=1123707 RepID=UPI0030EF1550|tara:strand:+ start:25390 stop:26430 length:1041 start_codon:yes stop_codon:yes gene_type:complete